MDNFIQSTFTLLVLSLVAERLTNVIKMQFESLFCKTGDVGAEKKREKLIQYVAIATGLAVALAAKANIFLMHQDDFKLFWEANNAKGETLTSDIIGATLCGLFLSLGSKFFHDLLDLLLEAKNLKRTVAEGSRQNLEGLKEQGRTSLIIKSTAIEAACKPVIESIAAVKGVSNVLLEFGDKPVLRVFIDETFDLKHVLPSDIPYTLATGDSGLVAVKVERGKPVTHSTVGPGAGLRNQTPYAGNTGSAGGVLYDQLTNEPSLFTCYHVVKSPSHNWDNFSAIGHEGVLDASGKAIGTIRTARRDELVDGALIKNGDNISFDGSISGIGLILLSRRLGINDKVYATKVKMYGYVSRLSVGYVVDIGRPASITYVDGNVHTLNDLIIVKGYQQSTFSKGGDSGSFVVDQYNYLIGVLVGGNNDLSFVIPMDNINSRLKTKNNIA